MYSHMLSYVFSYALICILICFHVILKILLCDLLKYFYVILIYFYVILKYFPFIRFAILLPSAICHLLPCYLPFAALLFAICCPAICHLLLFAICHLLLFAICYLLFAICHFVLSCYLLSPSTYNKLIIIKKTYNKKYNNNKNIISIFL